MSRVGKIVVGILGFLVVVVVLLGGLLLFLITRSFPVTDGEVKLTGLNAPVEVHRDSFGIPHIYGQTPHDLYFAQGYVQAQDRFYQMDFWRHIGAGRLSEMFGPSRLETDRFLRTLGWERVAEQELALFDPESRAILDDFSEGVNAYLEERQGASLSLEYALLQLLVPDYQPEPWDPVDTLLFAKLMAWDLGGSKLDAIIQKAELVHILTPEQVADLIPPYPERHPVIVNHPHLVAGAGPAPENDPTLATQIAPSLGALGRQLAEVEALMGNRGLGVGSNSWAISGDLSATGMPILANDPHLSAQLPSIWYEVGLHCVPQGPDCSTNLVGYAFSSAPGVVLGHNDRVAWGFTNVGPNVVDLYIEKINPENPNQYEVNGEWVDMEITEEVLQAGGGESETLTIRATRHGPIISKVYGLEDFASRAGMDVPAPYALALRWTALDPGLTLQAVLGFNEAQNWEEFRDAAADFSDPSQNLLYADVDGNIGYQLPGRIPIRNPGHLGDLPVPGWTDDYEWQDFIPFEDLAFTFNPPEGYIVTANNAVVGPEYPYLLNTVWAYGYRAQRIVDMIEEGPRPMDLAYMQVMQGDDRDLNAARLVPILLQTSMGDEHLEGVKALLQGWDYQSHMDSPPAALFQAFWKHLLAETFRDELPEDHWPTGGTRWFEVAHHIADDPQNPWWDDLETPEQEGRDQIFQRSFALAVEELENSLGANPDRWGWGDLHELMLENQSLGQSGISFVERLFNRGPYASSGGAAIVNATSWDASREDYRVLSLPSMRMIVDLSDLTNSLAIHPTGQSGHAFHPHYVDMVELWRKIEYHPMLWAQEDVEAERGGLLRLTP